MVSANRSTATVVKVGGSLYDLPDLRLRLRDWIRAANIRKIVLVPGGGSTVDAVRRLDEIHKLGEERAHWLALRALGTNAQFLACLLRGGEVIRDHAELPALWRRNTIPVLDIEAFAQNDDQGADALPHCWSVTSDSLSARVAHVIEAGRLVLLKSIDVPEQMTWEEAARHGWVDPHFSRAAKGNFAVQVVNLRRWSPAMPRAAT
jgi:aspartokinase-like uncharacterized kinase